MVRFSHLSGSTPLVVSAVTHEWSFGQAESGVGVTELGNSVLEKVAAKRFMSVYSQI
jgi:hypothetical protein